MVSTNRPCASRLLMAQSICCPTLTWSAGRRYGSPATTSMGRRALMPQLRHRAAPGSMWVRCRRRMSPGWSWSRYSALHIRCASTRERRANGLSVFANSLMVTKQVGRPTRVQYGDVPYAAGVGSVGTARRHYSPAAQLEPELTPSIEGQRRVSQDLAAGHRGPQLGGAQAGSIAVVVRYRNYFASSLFLFL